MYSAPAILRTPVLSVPATATSTPDMTQHEVLYPWAVHTPEASPRCWDKVDCFAPQVPELSFELLQSVCAPYFEQMCQGVAATVSAQQTPAAGIPSRELLREMCEPFFEQMTVALQRELHQQALTPTQFMCSTCQPTTNSGIQFETSPFFRFDEESTEADDSCAFASLLSSASSDNNDAMDSIERKSDGSEPTSDAVGSIMVCRHWKSKGWCRLESNCKFLHPEHKRGISAPCGAESALAPPKRKKRGGKNKAIRMQPQ